MRQFLGAHARKGWVRAFLVVLLFPFAMAYILGTVVVAGARRAVWRPWPAREAHRGPETRLRFRYRGSQRLIDRREQRLVGALLLRVGELSRVLDVPVGYGRFLSPLRAVATRQLVVADISGQRLAAVATTNGRDSPRVCVDLERGLPFTSGAFDLVFNFRHLHHVNDPHRRGAILAELVRVSRRYVVVSYYRGSNLHALLRESHTATRGDRRPAPAMMGRGELAAACRALGWRLAMDGAVLPWVHAHRVALLERIG